ncbi:MAG: hypothetical protein H8E26_09610 [FCB group bacterium]|nr:hypothetical protein [FCB group bacterium]MBL7029187.1 hypothetical protein [Candidatus Neomarinimicrobiota bacterium]MBL7120491.1 hypothetical protein [Candidatus Neomarinimicrobiota bacterium]
MKRHTRIISLAIPFLMTGILNTCTEPPEDGRIILENNLSTLSNRVTYVNQAIEIDTTLQTGGLAKPAVDPVSLVLIAEVDPPTIDGQVLQATDIYIKKNKAYVSYNMIGEPYLGAVDIFDIKDEEDPELESSMLFTDSDINGLTFKDNYLYLAMATNRDEFDSPAVVEKVRVRNDALTDETETFDVPSWAATDVEVTGNHLFVTSGADSGHVTVIRLNNDEVVFSYPVEDARGVATDGDDVAVVAGTPARMVTFDYDSGELLNDYELEGASIDFSKSTIEIHRKKAVLALGDGGTQIICLEDGSVVEQIAPPVVDDLDPSVTVTNAASTDSKTLYMSNGEAGVYVAYTRDKFNSRDCDVDDLQLIGQFRLDDLESVNAVKVDDDYLFIAGGLGGLKILEVTEED